MAESNIDIILRTKREGDAPQQTVEDLQAMQGGLTNLEKAMAGTRSTVGGLDQDISLFGTNLGSTADLLSGLGISIPLTPMQGFGMAVQAAGNFLKDSISDYTAYVAEVDKVATYTGMASEETSKLIQAADDLRINTGTLEMALKTMTQNGVTPSIDGLKELADKYNALRDPADKAKFLNDNFGRSGVEMARLMEIGAEGIQDATDAVSEYMIVTGKSKEQAEQYMLALDDLEDTWAAFKYQIGEAVIPALTDLIDTSIKSNEEIQNGGAQWMRYIPFLSQARQAYIQLKSFMDVSTDTVHAQADGVSELATAWNNASNAASNYSNQSGSVSNLPPSTYCGIPGHPNYPHSHANYSYYGSGKASGGEVTPGNIYKVGERETELLVLNQPGTIIPTTSNGNQPIIFNYQPTISLADREEAKRILLPYIQEAMRNA